MSLATVTKCHGTGNDFVLLDDRGRPLRSYADIAQALCKRRSSLGADGLLVLRQARQAGNDVELLIFNADGSQAQTCGNGIRCVALFLQLQGCAPRPLRIETGAGIVQARILRAGAEPLIEVSMGVPKLAAGQPALVFDYGDDHLVAVAVWVGNLHHVIFTDRDPSQLNLGEIAQRANDAAGSESNVELCQVRTSEIMMRVLERGVGETWACGSGACAVAAAAISSGNARSPVDVRSRGGCVRVEWSGPNEPALLTGDAHLVYQAEVEIA